MEAKLGRPAKAADPARAGADALVGWLARTHRYNASDAESATAATFAARMTAAGAPRSIGPAMISRLERGTASWQAQHLASYERALGLPGGRLAGPAQKVLRAHGDRGDDRSWLRSAAAAEQRAADIIDGVLAADTVTAADWDLLSAHLLATGRRLGRRTWGALVERLMLEICAAQGIDQELRAEALLRIGRAEIAVGLAGEVAIGAMTQRGNPASFQPLKIYQRAPSRAPAAWVVRALLDPPDRWLLRELFTTVAALVDAGSWRPSAQQLNTLRRECQETINDAQVELEVRRAAVQLSRRLHPAPHLGLHGEVGPDLVYLAKPARMDPQTSRYQAACLRLAAEIQGIGLVWQAKWEQGEDSLLGHILVQSLLGHDDTTRSVYTTLLVNSGYRDALRHTLARWLHQGADHQDPGLLRAVIRLFGKVAEGREDGWTLLNMIGADRIETDTRVQACWALANAAPRMPPDVPDTMLEFCRGRSFGAQATTALRSAVAACGRRDRRDVLRLLAEDRDQALAVRDECRWWNALPGYVRQSVSLAG
ncbi:hypothetical protein [Actinomadura formosensis]|uniref:hypothetical protein n=1 Tax=Actinomadura formosensis TaxID=60706 RepID=UPI0008344FC8|nr:hypothetical protein [Actinomadura formosensis]